MEATEMDVEEPSHNPSPNSSSFKRFGLKTSIQTNFGDDYVFQIAPKDDSTLMAVSLSTNSVKLYSPTTGQYIGECKGHSATINHISFSCPSNPDVLHSCSTDGTIRAWDTRTFKQVFDIRVGNSQEIFSFAFGGSGDNLLAAGCKSQILFWDWRNRKQVACLEDSHVDDVTQVLFIPDHQNKLVSTSVDGLMCIFRTDGDINDDDNLESVINVGTSIGKVDYFVDCFQGEDERLWVIGGTNAGTVGFFPVTYRGMGGIGAAEAVLEGGHTGLVRSVLPFSNAAGIFGWTGGEDGRLCCWLSDESSEINHSWTSSALVMKSPHISRKKNRHHPY